MVFQSKELIMMKNSRVENLPCTLISLFLLLLAVLCTLFLFTACGKDDLTKEGFKTENQAVFLVNGAVYFGKIEKMGNKYIEMTDVYYIQSQQNPDTKQIDSRLVKRGREFHGPDRIYINNAQVLYIEPVAPDSKIAQTMKEIRQNISK